MPDGFAADLNLRYDPMLVGWSATLTLLISEAHRREAARRAPPPPPPHADPLGARSP